MTLPHCAESWCCTACQGAGCAECYGTGHLHPTPTADETSEVDA
jgi:hypothetical protein